MRPPATARRAPAVLLCLLTPLLAASPARAGECIEEPAYWVEGLEKAARKRPWLARRFPTISQKPPRLPATPSSAPPAGDKMRSAGSAAVCN